MDPTEVTAEPISKAGGALGKNLQKGRKYKKARERRHKKNEKPQREPQDQRREEEEVLHGPGVETPAAAYGGLFVGGNSVEDPCWSQGKGEKEGAAQRVMCTDYKHSPRDLR